jgi:putative molybdenum carrier protein
MNEIRVVSGGQTGADRAALDFAIKHGFEHGGWCPKGRLAEDGPLPKQLYPGAFERAFDPKHRR